MSQELDLLVADKALFSLEGEAEVVHAAEHLFQSRDVLLERRGVDEDVVHVYHADGPLQSREYCVDEASEDCRSVDEAKWHACVAPCPVW